jgi:hypothetical protein
LRECTPAGGGARAIRAARLVRVFQYADDRQTGDERPLTCPLDTGVGGVQVVLRDLVHALRNGTKVHFIYGPHQPAPDQSDQWLGPSGVLLPDADGGQNSALLSLPVFLAYLPITLFHLTA